MRECHIFDRTFKEKKNYSKILNIKRSYQQSVGSQGHKILFLIFLFNISMRVEYTFPGLYQCLEYCS